jgi:hypothetical protein
VIAYSPLSL